MNAKEYVEKLQLLPHPEGGFFKETYRSEEHIPHSGLPERFTGNRSFSTSIYFLLEKGDFSAFHRIKSDESWHFYAGDTLKVHVIENSGNAYTIKLGRELGQGEVFQFVVPANTWFASEPAEGANFALVGCTVAPGFDFSDFEMAKKKVLIAQFPQHKQLIERLCRE